MLLDPERDVPVVHGTAVLALHPNSLLPFGPNLDLAPSLGVFLLPECTVHAGVNEPVLILILANEQVDGVMRSSMTLADGPDSAAGQRRSANPSRPIGAILKGGR